MIKLRVKRRSESKLREYQLKYLFIHVSKKTHCLKWKQNCFISTDTRMQDCNIYTLYYVDLPLEWYVSNPRTKIVGLVVFADIVMSIELNYILFILM